VTREDLYAVVRDIVDVYTTSQRSVIIDELCTIFFFVGAADPVPFRQGSTVTDYGL